MVMKHLGSRHRRLTAHESTAAYGEAPEGQGLSRAIPAGEFKARCLALMDEVCKSGGEYVITKRGVPVARLLPARDDRRPLLGSLKGTVTTRGDVVAPIDVPWSVLAGWDGKD